MSKTKASKRRRAWKAAMRGPFKDVLQEEFLARYAITPIASEADGTSEIEDWLLKHNDSVREASKVLKKGIQVPFSGQFESKRSKH